MPTDNKSYTQEIIKHYDKKNDIYGLWFGERPSEYSMELFDGKLILDFKGKEIVGFEIFDFKKEIRKFGEKLDRITKKKEAEDANK